MTPPQEYGDSSARSLTSRVAALVTIWPAVLMCAVVVPVAFLAHGRGDLYEDEGFTAAESQLPWRTLAHVVARRELNGSLHTILMWLLGLGGSIELQRALSVVVGCVAIIVLYDLLRRFGVAAAIAGVAVVLINPSIQFDLVYGRENALALLAEVGALNLGLRALDTGSRRLALAAAVIGGCSVYAHFYAGLSVILAGLWVVLEHRRRWPAPRGTLLIAALSLVPLAGFFLSGGASAGQMAPTPTRSAHDYFAGVVGFIAGGAQGQRVLQGVALLAVAVLLGLGWRAGRNRTYLRLGIGGAGGVLALVALASRASPGLYSTDYLNLALPLFGIAVAASVGSFDSRRCLVSGAVVGLAIACAWTVTVQSARTSWVVRHPWTAAAHAIASDPHEWVTSMVPYESFAARLQMTRAVASTHFVPPAPTTTSAVLESLSYGDRPGCLPAGEGWVVTTSSPDFDQALPRAMACHGQAVLKDLQFGPVEAVLVGPKP